MPSELYVLLDCSLTLHLLRAACTAGVLKDIELLLDYLSSFVGPHRGRDSDRMLPWILQRCTHTLQLLCSRMKQHPSVKALLLPLCDIG